MSSNVLERIVCIELAELLRVNFAPRMPAVGTNIKQLTIGERHGLAEREKTNSFGIKACDPTIISP